MTRVVAAALAACSLMVALPGGTGSVLGQARYLWVNTTEDRPLEVSQCLPGQPCTFRKAVELAEGFQRVVTACFEPGVVPGARPCPGGVLPLTRQDPNYDAASGRWTLEVRSGTVPFVLFKGGTTIDFSHGVESWASPLDNRVVLDADLNRDTSANPRTDIILVEGSDNVIRGLEVRGSFQVAAIIVRGRAANNQFGPGLALAGMPQGVGISFENRETVGNKVVGIWCGLGGDGQLDPLSDDCIRFHAGASASVVGGTEPEERNVLVGSDPGVGVSIEGRTTRDITVQGNYIGVGVDGMTPLGNQAGIRVVDGASNVRIVGNVIAGNRNNGIAVFGESQGTHIEGNRIGLGVAGTGCVGNSGVGISLQGGVSGGLIAGNVVHCNREGGIVLRDSLVQAVRITGNSVSRNQGKAILVASGANLGVQPPSLLPQSEGVVRGRTCPGCTVELFSDALGEAEVFEGSVTGHAGDGTFAFEKDRFAFRALAATSTDDGNTSALSEAVYLPRDPRPTATEFGYQTPTPRPTGTPEPTEPGQPPRPTSTEAPPGVFRFAYLPWTHRGPTRPVRPGRVAGF